MALVAARALLIANPGSREGARRVDPARDAFRDAGVEVDVILTESRGHGGRMAAELAEQYDAIFTLGGDGTAMEVVQALSGSNRAVGILPGGTGNLIARVLGIPLDVRLAVPALVRGDEEQIDLGRLGDGRLFAITAGTGIDAEMIASAPVEMRRRFGVFAYFATATRSLLSSKPFSVRATVDGRVIEREQCLSAMIVNIGSVLDGFLELGPGISHKDGLLDLCLFSARDLFGAAALAGRVAVRDFANDAQMVFDRGRHVTVETVPTRIAQADGEMIGETPMSADVMPLGARLLVPRRKA